LQVLKYYLKGDWHCILLLLPVKPLGLWLGGEALLSAVHATSITWLDTAINVLTDISK